MIAGGASFAPSRWSLPALAIAEGVRRHELTRLVVPRARAREAALVPDVEILGVESLEQVVTDPERVGHRRQRWVHGGA